MITASLGHAVAFFQQALQIADRILTTLQVFNGGDYGC